MKWISVKDRLPEIGVPVLCAKKYNKYFIGMYTGCHYSDGYAAFQHIEKNMTIGVAYWIPLPELPNN